MRILKEGYSYIIPLVAVGGVLILISVTALPPPANIICQALGNVLVVLSLFCMFFFRDPNIEITQGEGIILSPCNGTVMDICEEDGEKVIRVFLSVFSVHLQRAPFNGTVVDVVHKNGKFLAAWNPRAHIENEQNIFTIQTGFGIMTIRQIAGLVARRCVAWVKPGDILKAGDKIGMIKFSSQVDLHLPVAAKVLVKPGDKTEAGITIVAAAPGYPGAG